MFCSRSSRLREFEILGPRTEGGHQLAVLSDDLGFVNSSRVSAVVVLFVAVVAFLL